MKNLRSYIRETLLSEAMNPRTLRKYEEWYTTDLRPCYLDGLSPEECSANLSEYDKKITRHLAQYLPFFEPKLDSEEYFWAWSLSKLR